MSTVGARCRVSLVRGITRLAVAAACAFAPAHVSADTVCVEGTGATRSDAVHAALRTCVERTVGVRISSGSVVDNYQLIADHILTRAEGYVTSYDVTAERRELGLVTVSVCADVAMGRIEDSLSAQKLLYAMQSSPRIAVMLDERVGATPSFEKVAAGAFTEKLVERGFIVLDNATFDAAAARGGDNAFANQAFRQGADLLVRGEVSAAQPTPKTVFGVQMYTVPVSINARIVQADNGRVLAARSTRVKKNSREAASAERFALATAGTALCDKLIDDLMAFWQDDAFSETDIELILDGGTAKGRALAESLAVATPTVRDLRLRFLEGDRAVYDVSLRGSVQGLRAGLERDGRHGYTTAAVSPHRLLLRPADAPPPTADTASAAIEILELDIRDVFPSLMRRYETTPLAHVRLRAASGSVRDVKLSVIVPDVMRLPAEMRLGALRAGSDVDTSLVLVLDANTLFGARETRTVYGKAVVSWTGPNGTAERTLTAPVKLYDENAMDWSQPRAVAAFATYRDPPIDRAARTALRSLPAHRLPDGLAQGLALFELMQAQGIRYVRDPVSSPGLALLDRVQFPRQTLAGRSGDCDDLAVLYASLLSAVGVHAGVVVFRDHVLTIFDSGTFRKNRYALTLDTALCMEDGGTLWIPVETTMLDRGFGAAWHEGASELNAALRERQPVAIVVLDDAWREYPPAALPSAKTAALDTAGLARLVRGEIERHATETRTALTRLGSELQAATAAGKNVTAAQWNRVGVIKVRTGDLAGARECFETALGIDRTPHIESNRACALLLMGGRGEACAILDTLAPRDASGRIAMNRALCLMAGATAGPEMDAALAAWRRAAARMPEGALSAYLGLELTASDGTRAADKSENDARAVNLRRLKELIRARVLSSQSDTAAAPTAGGTTSETSSGSVADGEEPIVMPFGGIRGADPTQVAEMADLLFWFEEMP